MSWLEFARRTPLKHLDLDHEMPLSLEKVIPAPPIPPQLQKDGMKFSINDWKTHNIHPVTPISPDTTHFYSVPLGRATAHFPHIFIALPQDKPLSRTFVTIAQMMATRDVRFLHTPGCNGKQN